MPGLATALATNLGDDVVGGDAGGLVVDQQPARGLLGHGYSPSWAATSPQMKRTSSSYSRSVENPAARL